MCVCVWCECVCGVNVRGRAWCEGRVEARTITRGSPVVPLPPLAEIKTALSPFRGLAVILENPWPRDVRVYFCAPSPASATRWSLRPHHAVPIAGVSQSVEKPSDVVSASAFCFSKLFGLL